MPRPITEPSVRDGLLPLPGRVPALQARGAVLAQVDEVLRLRRELRDEADLDRLDVVGACTRREMLRERGVMRRVVLGVLLDGDTRVRRLVLRVEVVVAEVAEDVDRERDVARARDAEA